MPNAALRVAVVQGEVAPDLAAGLARTAALAREAADAGAQLIVFPETWLPGYPAWLDVCRDVVLWDHPPVKAVYARMAAESVVVPGPASEALAAPGGGAPGGGAPGGGASGGGAAEGALPSRGALLRARRGRGHARVGAAARARATGRTTAGPRAGTT